MNLSFIRIKKAAYLFALSIIFTFAAQAQTQEDRKWKTFTPDTKDWSILAPGTMQTDPEAIDSLGKKGGYSYRDGTGFFAVVYENSAGWVVMFNKPFIGSHYKKIRDSFVKSSKGKLIKDEKFKANGDSGREFYVEIPDGRVLDNEGQLKSRTKIGRFRIFFHGNRCYMLLAVVPQDQVNTFPINDYFTSFVANK